MDKGRNKIAVDIDGVVCNLQSAIRKALAKEGKTVDESVYPWADEEWFISNPNIYLEGEAIDSAVERLRFLGEDNDLIFLTRRHRNAHRQTLKWFSMLGFCNPTVIHTSDKGLTARELNVTYAIDDSPADIESYMRMDIPVYVVPYPYNREYQKGLIW